MPARALRNAGPYSGRARRACASVSQRTIIIASPSSRSTTLSAPAKPGSASSAGIISWVTMRSIASRRSGVVPPSMTWAYMGSARFRGGEEVAEVEAVGLEHRAPVGVEPVVAGAVVIELDAIAVGVVEVDGDGAAVVGAVVDLEAVVEQSLHGAAELVAVGIQERHVVEAGVARGRRRGASALPGV